MTRIKIICAALAVPFLISSCVTDRSQESAETLDTLEASTDEVTEEVTEELDPNDPNVLVCPVTGQMQLKSAGGEGATHGGGTDF